MIPPAHSVLVRFLHVSCVLSRQQRYPGLGGFLIFATRIRHSSGMHQQQHSTVVCRADLASVCFLHSLALNSTTWEAISVELSHRARVFIPLAHGGREGRLPLHGKGWDRLFT